MHRIPHLWLTTSSGIPHPGSSLQPGIPHPGGSTSRGIPHPGVNGRKHGIPHPCDGIPHPYEQQQQGWNLNAAAVEQAGWNKHAVSCLSAATAGARSNHRSQSAAIALLATRSVVLEPHAVLLAAKQVAVHDVEHGTQKLNDDQGARSSLEGSFGSRLEASAGPRGHSFADHSQREIGDARRFGLASPRFLEGSEVDSSARFL